ncbi:MAG: hypothetical protein JO277_09955 [Candidatus Eremiobacteraeota bacterium]|nr:hypothetical protein [Candidatus Eremiobacteraeota bacterium]
MGKRLTPQMAGPTMADIVTWKWDRSTMRWTATLRDGTELYVWLHRFGRRSFWDAFMNGTRVSDGHRDPTSAQDAALAHWRKQQNEEHFVEIVETATGKVERRMGPMSAHKAEKVEMGALVRIDTERFFVRSGTDAALRKEAEARG